MRSLVILLLILSGILSLDAPAGEPIRLEAAFKAALAKNEPVKQSDEQVEQANARLARLRGGLFPEISFTGLYLRQPVPDDPVALEFSPPNQTTAALTARQPIFRGLREFAGLRQQKQVRLAREAQRKQSAQRLYQEVTLSYLAVLSAERDLENLTGQVEIYEKRVAELKGRARRGESSASELLSGQSTLSALRAETRVIKGQLYVARENLHSLAGTPRDARLKDPELGGKFFGDLGSYLARIEQRPDIQAAAALREAADDGIAIARGQHFGVLDAVGNYYLKRPGFLSDLKWDVSLQFTLPIFQGGAISAQVREAASLDREAELELARVRRIANEEIRSFHEALSARLEQLSFLRQAVEHSEKNASVSQSEFRRGLIRSIDVQLALAEFRTSRRLFDQAHFAAQIDHVRLEVASGLIPEGAMEGEQR